KKHNPVHPVHPVILSIQMQIMSKRISQVYQNLCDHARETAKLASIAGLLEWDERTKMPAAAGAYRAEQISYLAGEIHKRQVAPEVGQWLDEVAGSELAADPHSETGTVIRQ